MGYTGTDQSSPVRWASRLHLLATVLAAYATAVGVLVLAGWVFDLPRVRDFTLSGITMKFNTSLATALAGVCALLLSRRPSEGRARWRTLAGRTAGALVLIVGGLALFEHLTGLALGFDELFWPDAPGELGDPSPGRMGQPTAACMTFVGLALLLLDSSRGRRWSITPSQILAVVVFTLAAFPAMGYAFGVNDHNTITRLTAISLYSATAMLALAAAIILLRPDRGIAAVLSHPNAGGSLVRRLLPWALVLPVLIGWFVRRGEIVNLYGGAFQVALLVLIAVLLLSAVVWWTGGALSRRAAAQSQAESRRAAIFQSALDAIITMDQEGRVLEWNAAAEKKFGYTRSEAVGRTVAELIIPPDWRGAHVAGLRRCLEGPPDGPITGPVIGQRLEATAINKAGDRLQIELAISAMRLGPGEAVFTAYARDLTERKSAESERALLAAIVESSEDAIISKNLDGIITSWNSGAERIFGYSAAEAVGKSITLIIPAERRDEEVTILERVGRGLRVDHFETVRVAKDGRRLNVSLTISPVRDRQGRVIGASKSARDITEQQRAASILARNTLLLSAVREAMIVTDLKGIVTYWNKGAEDLLGWTEEEMVGSYLPDRVPEPARTQMIAQIGELAQGKLEWDGEYEDRRKDGSRVWLYARVHRFNDQQGRPAGLIGVTHDITSRKRAEGNVRQSEERFRLALSSGSIVVYEQDADLRYTWVFPDDPGFPKPHLGHTDAELLPADEGRVLTEVKQEVLRTGRAMRREIRVTIPGGVRWYDLQVEARRDASGAIIGVGGAALDITIRKQAEEELQAYRERLEEMVAERTAALAELNRRSRQTERLAALGTLAAGLGHDLANLLLPIRTRLEVLEALDLPPQAREDIAATRSALSYIQRLSTGLRLMSADPEQRASAADHTQLSMWWQDVEGVLRTVLPRNVVLESDIPPDLSAAVPRHHLTQTVFNLVQNAGEAIAATPKGSGTVRVGARRQIVPMGGVSAHDNGSVESVEIAVSDNGPGMTPDVFARCFEPYFSTKGRAISTGMGLALVRGLVERAGGTVRVDSSQEKGTTFSLILPAAPAAPAAQAPKNSLLAVVSAMNGSRPGRTEALAAALLEALGVVVRRAPGPEGADIWVAGSPESSLVATFLGERPGRCVVLCDEAPPEPFAESWERVTFVGRQPKAADLRRALAWAVSRASRVASGWSSERHGSMVGAQGGERGDNA